MDEQLINAILGRQTAYIGDLTNKNIFLEAKISVLENQLKELTAKYDKEVAAKKIAKAA
jgi:hypothetical protein